MILKALPQAIVAAHCAADMQDAAANVANDIHAMSSWSLQLSPPERKRNAHLCIELGQKALNFLTLTHS
jgi:hypothetical protein